MMTIKYDENNNSKLAAAILYEWFKRETEVNINTISSVPPEDLINVDLGEVFMFVTSKTIPMQWINAFKALEDRGTYVSVISNCPDNTEALNEIHVDYNISNLHSIPYNAWDMLSKLNTTESNRHMPKMIEYTEVNNTSYRAFSIGFDIRDLGDPEKFFEQMIPKNDYNIFNPDKWESQRMNGFVKHCISDGEAIIRYQQWSAKQLKSDAASKYILKDSQDSDISLKVVAINSQINPIYAYNMYSKDYDLICTYFFNGEDWTYNIMKGSLSSIKKETYIKYANFISNSSSAEFSSAYWLLFKHGGDPINVPNGDTFMIIKNYKKHKFDICRGTM